MLGGGLYCIFLASSGEWSASNKIHTLLLIFHSPPLSLTMCKQFRISDMQKQQTWGYPRIFPSSLCWSLSTSSLCVLEPQTQGLWEESVEFRHGPRLCSLLVNAPRFNHHDHLLHCFYINFDSWQHQISRRLWNSDMVQDAFSRCMAFQFWE